ncbi:hypothetical protein QBC43DRAFT_30289 [Cladorrhinum sp. PSN259]|nr:hypothetical protein QBC43DRAFT_30289 [Cladorrhinum sp. PSN259]
MTYLRFQPFDARSSTPRAITIIDILLTERFDPQFAGMHAMMSAYQSFLLYLLQRIGLLTSTTFSADQFGKALGKHVQPVVAAMTSIQTAVTQMCGGIEVLDGSSLRTWRDFAPTWQGYGLQFDLIPSIIAVRRGVPVSSGVRVLAAGIELEALAMNRCYIAKCLRYLQSCVAGSVGAMSACGVLNPLGGLINDFPDVVFWSLNHGFAHCPDSRPERLLGVYTRHAVREEDCTPPEGMLSGIVKLELDFGGTRAYRGTGWLLDRSTIVTSGHNVVFNGRARRGERKHLVSVKATVGYSANKTTLTGEAVVVSRAWYHMAVKTHDIALIRVHGFFDAKPLDWMATPTYVQDMSGLLAGFPGDKEGMWYSRCDMQVDVCPESSKMVLFHRGETVEGSSGSPVISHPGGLVIAVHRGASERCNEAVILDDRSNNISEYRRILDHATGARCVSHPGDIRQVSSVGFQRATTGTSLKVTRYQIPPMPGRPPPNQGAYVPLPAGTHAALPAFTGSMRETSDTEMAILPSRNYHPDIMLYKDLYARPALQDYKDQWTRRAGHLRTLFNLSSGTFISTLIRILIFLALSLFCSPIVLRSFWCSSFKTPWICTV